MVNRAAWWAANRRGPTGGLESVIAAAMVLALVPVGHVLADDKQAPLETNLNEEVQARLLVKRIRIEPTKLAKLGECRELGVEDLGVRSHP